jgi:hypothetical protein
VRQWADPREELENVTVTAPFASRELADAPCSVGECFRTASTMGTATVRVDPRAGAPPDFASVVFGLPLCLDHAHLLRRGCHLIDFHSGL